VAETGRLFAVALLTTLGGLGGCDDCKGGSTVADAGTGGEPALVALDASMKMPEGGTLNATPLPTASVEAVLNPEKLPAYSGPTGSVEGTITVTGDLALPTPADFSRCPDAEKTWGHAFREGPAGPTGARPLADAIVVVTGYRGFHLAETREAAETRIEGCAYTTRTQTLTFGQRLEVKNLSKEFWTPVLEPQRSVVVMMAPPKGDAVRIYPKTPGHHLLLDRDRKFAVVDVYAFLHPLHTATSTTGYYRIDGLPVGKVRVGSTHPQINSNAETELVVTAGTVHKVDLVLKNVNKEAGAPTGADAGQAGPLR
jgi:hypothetical protein